MIMDLKQFRHEEKVKEKELEIKAVDEKILLEKKNLTILQESRKDVTDEAKLNLIGDDIKKVETKISDLEK